LGKPNIGCAKQNSLELQVGLKLALGPNIWFENTWVSTEQDEKLNYRKCAEKIASSLFWIILAAFRLQNLEAISTSVYASQNFESKIGSKEPKNRQKNLYGTLPIPHFYIVCFCGRVPHAADIAERC